MSSKKRVLFNSEASYLNTGYAAYGREVIKRLIATDKYEVAEYSCYGTPDDSRRGSIPWKNYPVAPSRDEKEANRNIYNSNPANQFGAWRFERTCLDFKPDMVCFPEGALICTDNGYKPIESLRVGDRVLTHKNRFMPITDTMVRDYDGELINIYGDCICEPMAVTPEHPVLIYKQKRQTNRKKSVFEIYNDETPVFVEAKDVAIGDYVVLPTYSEQIENVVIDLADYCEDPIFENDDLSIKSGTANSKFVNRFITVDHDFARLCGYIAADGYVSERSIQITLGDHEEEFIEDCCFLINKYFGVEASVVSCYPKKCTTVQIHRTILSSFMQKFITAGSSTYNIPKEIMLGVDAVKSGFVKGLVRGDGCYTNNMIRLTTVNRTAAYSYRAILASLGICSSITVHDYQTHWNVRYDVCCYGRNARALHDIVQKHNSVETPSDVVRSAIRTHMLSNKHVVCKVIDLRKTEYMGEVFNIEVYEDNSYTSQFCVHNCSQRDPWMESWIKHSPYRSIISWAWASTVDSEPQSPEWLNQFADADYFYTLSEWAAGVIKEQAGSHINHIGTVTSCAAEEFKPVPNKAAHRISMGINPDWKIIGTVMRNQRRKLFPDLFEAFGRYIHENNSTDTYLYCHTSYPDNGWDIPQLMMKNGISSRVLFSYACEACGAISINKFSDAVKQCKACKKFAAKLSSVSNGATVTELAKIYNLFDIFAQYSNSEGIGIPAIEAGACGVPIMAVDFSAMSSVVRSVNGYPIPVKVKALELETGCYRAIPDQDATVLYWKTFFESSEDERTYLSEMTRRAYESNYNWDKVINLWMQSIDDCPKADWNRPIRQINIPTETPKFQNNKEFVDWVFSSHMPYSNMVNSYEANCMLRDINFQCYKPNACGYFYAENSYFDRVNYQGFTQETLINAVKGKAEIFNFWEKARTGGIQFEKEDWL